MSNDNQQQPESGSNVQITVARIALMGVLFTAIMTFLGVLFTAIFTHWDKIFPSTKPLQSSSSQTSGALPTSTSPPNIPSTFASSTSISNSPVRLKNQNQCLNLRGGQTVEVSACDYQNGEPQGDQQWTIEEAGNFFRIKNSKYQNQCLNLRGGQTVEVSACDYQHGGPQLDQQWTREEVGNSKNVFRIKNSKNQNQCLNLLEGEGKTLNVSACNDQNGNPQLNQQWTIEKVAKQ